jgi:hypothetical protein
MVMGLGISWSGMVDGIDRTTDNLWNGAKRRFETHADQGIFQGPNDHFRYLNPDVEMLI